MPKTRNERVSTLLKSLGLDVMEASNRIRKQPATLYRIINNENEASKATLRILADELGANYEWLLTGQGTMMNPAPQAATESHPVNYRDDLIKELQADKTFLQKEVDRLLNIIGRLAPAEHRPTGSGFYEPFQLSDLARVISIHTTAPGLERAAS